MSVRHEPWPQGTPAWVDLTVPDRHTAREFYGSLFGWTFEENGPEFGYYTNCLLDGEPVAGIGEPVGGGDEAPPAWVTYLAADDAEAVAGQVAAAGGRVLVEPVTVPEWGRFAWMADATGVLFGLWESGGHTGMNRANEPGSVTWNEVHTRDYDTAQRFYREVFGFSFDDLPSDDGRYATLQLGNQPVGGIGEIGPGSPTEPHWATYFSVADTDETIARATSLGGSVRQEAFDSEFGRIAVLQGPDGETFSVLGPVAGDGA